MGRAAKIRVIETEELTKTLTSEDFLRVMRSANFVGAYAYWRQLERVARPEESTCLHARGILRAMAELHFRDCRGVAFSEQHAEAFRYCGFEPVRCALPGELAW